MGLRTYREKRYFGQTPEPRGERAESSGALRFVVQKHDASRLHYDFRLELDGVLKSWAVPKGPSLDPGDKRLAVMVEDHPLSYRTFEGTIPTGNYGAGTVMVWDEGTYHSRQSSDRRESEKILREGLDRGHITFVLGGQKLKGEFSLVRLRQGKGNNWLLVKKRDDRSPTKDVTKLDQSVSTGRDLDEIAQGRKTRKKAIKTTSATNGHAHNGHATKPLTAIKSGQVRPMLATLVKEPFDRAGWLFEVKWDGYRAIAEVGTRHVALYSRNHNSFERQFSPIVKSLRLLGRKAVLDGEVVVVDEQGRARFQLLQNYRRTGEGHLRYYVFDILSLDGRDLRSLPLRERKAILADVIGDLPEVFLSEHVEDRGIAFFKAAREQGLEGIVAKSADSPYREGQRGPEWLKIKTQSRQEAVIGGFTEPRGSRKDLGALLLGVYESSELIYIGHTGGGFDTASRADMRKRLRPLVSKECPFSKQPKPNAPVHWVKPQLVCEVTFGEWTDDGIMRQPIFLGIREDKPAREVRREMPVRPPLDGGSPDSKAKGRGAAARKKATRRSTTKAEDSQPKRLFGDVHITNEDKVYWPKEGYTKGDLIAYYREIASVILPYLHDRPESLNRHPNGIEGKSFFQKDVSHQPPPAFVKTVTISSESAGRDLEYLLCQNELSLLYLANLGCIELNPWNSRVGSLDNPDYLVIDLDPQDVPFGRVIEAALAVRKALDHVGVEGLCKTSGKRGLHVFVPLGARYDYDQAKQFAELIASRVHQALPETTSLVRSPALRKKRIYLDFLQNRRGQTLAAPYCVRPYPGATVSTPLSWREVGKKLDPSKFTIKTLPRRIDKVGELWKPILGKGVDLSPLL